MGYICGKKGNQSAYRKSEFDNWHQMAVLTVNASVVEDWANGC